MHECNLTLRAGKRTNGLKDMVCCGLLGVRCGAMSALKTPRHNEILMQLAQRLRTRLDRSAFHACPLLSPEYRL
jgi:hypothetical protein